MGHATCVTLTGHPGGTALDPGGPTLHPGGPTCNQVSMGPTVCGMYHTHRPTCRAHLITCCCVPFAPTLTHQPHTHTPKFHSFAPTETPCTSAVCS